MGPTPKFSEEQLQQLCHVLANSTTGLTGSEIGTYLLRLAVADPGTAVTKSVRLFEALSTRQNRDKSGEAVAAFLSATMNRSRYAGNTPLFDSRRKALNHILNSSGCELDGDGKLGPVSPRATPDSSEPGRQAASLKHELSRRGMHPLVLALATPELLAVTEDALASALGESVAQRLRELTGAAGAALGWLDELFPGDPGRTPRVHDDVQASTQRREHASLIHLVKALLSAVPDADEDGQKRPSDQDLLDRFALASMIHRRLDDAKLSPRPRREAARTDRSVPAKELGH